jgi:hypothetical protein
VPFTVSHAAAVLPLRRVLDSRLPLSALMIGSMAPDFAYFYSHASERLVTHSLHGIFTFAWPVGFVVWWLYVRFLEEPSIALLPDPWRRRFVPTGKLTLRLLAWVSTALIVGAATHILWDAFTHRSTFITRDLAVFRMHPPGMRWLPVFEVLQVLSSIFGLLVLWRWAMNLRHAPQTPYIPPYEISNRLRLGVLAVLTGSAVLLALIYWLTHLHWRFDAQVFMFFIGGMSGWVIAWFAVALWMRAKLYRPGDHAAA